MMFKPFDFGKWFALGFIIFLESLVQGGGGGGNIGNPFGGSGGSKGGGGSLPTPEEAVRWIDQGLVWLQDHLDIVLAIGIPSVLLLTVIGVLIVWLGCHGQMMFIRAVALDDPSIGENWRATKICAGSLFKFRIVLSVISLMLTLGTVVAIAAIVNRLLRAGSMEISDYVLQILPIGAVATAAFIVLGLVGSMLRNFVTPLMYRFGEGCIPAWKRFGAIARTNIGPIIVFLVLRICFSFAAAILAMIVMLLTCCLGALPVLHQVVMSPWYVFDRAWSLYAIGALGPEFEIMRERAEA